MSITSGRKGMRTVRKAFRAKVFSGARFVTGVVADSFPRRRATYPMFKGAFTVSGGMGGTHLCTATRNMCRIALGKRAINSCHVTPK